MNKRKIIFLNESILDPIHKTRSVEIFDKNDEMHSNVKDYIESTFRKWYDQLNDKTFTIDCFKMIGSSSGFQYTPTSDIDVQVFAKFRDGVDPIAESKKLFRILPNGNLLPGTQHPVNYFLVDVDNPVPFRKLENLYNLETKEWEKKTDKPEIVVPIQYVREVSRFFTDAFDLSIGRYHRDKEYLEDVLRLDPMEHDISEEEKDKAVDSAINNFKASIDGLRLGVQLIYGFLLEAYDENKFFHVSIQYSSDDPRFSMNNLIYKTLDRFEYREKMWDLIKEGREFLKKIKKSGDK